MSGTGGPTFVDVAAAGAAASTSAAAIEPARSHPVRGGAGRDAFSDYQCKRRQDALARQKAARTRAANLARQIAVREVRVYV